MAHAARSFELVRGLISSITGQQDVSKARCTQVIKGLREHNFARTNQFAITSKLNGLVEKFSVLNRDDLAEALRTRLDQLHADDKFLPEKLALFIELSDLPHRKVDLGVLDVISEQVPVAEVELTWADIIRDDPLDGDIWNDVERGYHSSGDEHTLDVSDRSSTSGTSVDEDLEAVALAQLIPAQDEVLNALSLNTAFSELKLVRETLFMLRGLPADSFIVDRVDHRVIPSTSATLLLTTQPATQGLLKRAANIGSSLGYLRQWCKSPQKAAYMRTLQAVLQNQLQSVDVNFTAVERALVSKDDKRVVSMMALCSYAEEQARPFVLLAATLRQAEASPSSSLLEQLYGRTCNAHATADTEALAIFLELLVASTQIFLRPIAQWCLSGEIGDQEHPLVVDSQPDCPLSSIWHERFSLRNVQGTLPAFLTPFAQDMFALGKSRMFSKHLEPGTGETNDFHHTRVQLTGLDHVENSLVPLSQQLHTAIAVWLESLRTLQEKDVVRLLLNNHRLVDRFDALERMLLRKDGSAFSYFSETLLGMLRRGTFDDFAIAELARESFRGIGLLSADDTSVTTVTTLGDRILPKVASLQMHFAMPWFMANITRNREPIVHQQSFTLLLQLDISKRLLIDDITMQRNWKAGRNYSVQSQLCWLQQSLITFIDTMTFLVSSSSEQLCATMKQDLTQATTLDNMVEAYGRFEDALGLVFMTRTQTKPIRDTIAEILILAEDLAQTKQSMHPDTSSVGRMTGHFTSRLHLLIDALRTEALDKDAETFEHYADALLACLAPSPRRALLA